MADTLVRWSGEGPPNPAWDDVDEAISVARTLALRARLRAAHAGGGSAPAALAERLGLSQLERIYRILSFIVLGVMLLAISFAYQKKWITLPVEAPRS